MHSFTKYKHTYTHYINTHKFIQTLTFLPSDIDEFCNGTHNCSQICTKTNGSFICGCYSGYLLDIDGATCNGMHI